MIEFFIYLCGIIYAGYFTGSMFKRLIEKAIFNYHLKYYLNMVFNILLIPLLPLLFFGLVILLGVGYEFYYFILTGQL